jgi:hypothetical protein
MLSSTPVIDPAVRALRPDFVALSLVARGARNGPSDAESATRLAEACEPTAEHPEPGEVVWPFPDRPTASARSRRTPGSRPRCWVPEPEGPGQVARITPSLSPAIPGHRNGPGQSRGICNMRGFGRDR